MPEHDSLASQMGRLMGEAMADLENYDTGVPATTPREKAAYRDIAARRRKAAAREEALLARTRVTPGDLPALARRLQDLAKIDRAELAHRAADQALLDFIGDPLATAAFQAIDKWYS